jgi:hypothetical protein
VSVAAHRDGDVHVELIVSHTPSDPTDASAPAWTFALARSAVEAQEGSLIVTSDAAAGMRVHTRWPVHT